MIAMFLAYVSQLSPHLGDAQRDREQTNAPLLRCHPDRLTVTSKNDTSFSRMPRGCVSDQPRVMVGLSGWSAFSGVFICF